jgi:hypothetical protein
MIRLPPHSSQGENGNEIFFISFLQKKLNPFHGGISLFFSVDNQDKIVELFSIPHCNKEKKYDIKFSGRVHV